MTSTRICKRSFAEAASRSGVRFAIPIDLAGPADVAVYDVTGRKLRSLDDAIMPGTTSLGLGGSPAAPP